MYVVKGRLEPEVGAVLMRAVEAASDALFRREDDAGAGSRGSEDGDSRPEPTTRRGDTSRHRGASPGRKRNEPSLPLCRERQRCPDVFALQIREVLEDLRFRHPGRQVLKDIVHRDPEPTNARLAAPLFRLKGDAIQMVHSL